MISDRHGMRASIEAGIEEVEVCGMHDGDKVGASSLGDLVRRKNGAVVNSFPQGQAIKNKMHDVAKYFSYSTRLDDLHKKGREAEIDFAAVKPKIDHNGTRVAAQYFLFKNNLRLNKALQHFGDVVPASSKFPKILMHEWELASGIFGVLDITRLLCTVSQYEDKYVGGYGPYLQTCVYDKLREDSLKIVDFQNVTKSLLMPTLSVRVVMVDLPPVVQMTRSRAILEMERRIFGNTTCNVNRLR